MDDETSCSCMICLEPYIIGEKVSYFKEAPPECRHVFHHECITEWLMRQNECPGCRTTYIVEDNHKEKSTSQQEQCDEEAFSNEEDEQNIDLEQGDLPVQEKIETNQVLRIVDGLLSKTTTRRKGLKYSLVPDPEYC
mmetsp:Transcript_31790/g.46761  ORF Transcript_31790/g.46761 Transcript_31790/m.46761 type:complete len:137 (+) Transcript_31790:630-1040(+)